MTVATSATIAATAAFAFKIRLGRQPAQFQCLADVLVHGLMNVMHLLLRLKEAGASYAHALTINPQYAEAYFNQSLYFLLMGRFEQGWRQYEWRNKRDGLIKAGPYPQPLWLGEEQIEGKTLFLHGEQGLGDTIQFCRYAKLVEGRCAKLIMSVQQPLRELLKQISPICTSVPARTPFPQAYRTADIAYQAMVNANHGRGGNRRLLSPDC